MSSLRDNQVGNPLGRLDELQVHGFQHPHVTVHHGLRRTSAFNHIPLDNTYQTFVGVGIHKDAQVHLLAETTVAQGQNPFDDDHLARLYMNGLLLAGTGQVGIHGLFDGLAPAQHLHVLRKQIPVEGRRMVEVDVLPFFYGHMAAVLVI